MFRTSVVAAMLMIACKPPTTPTQPVAPLPPDLDAEGNPMPRSATPSSASKGSASTGSASEPVAATPPAKHVDFAAFPQIPAAPVSAPTGAPIVLPAPVVKVGDGEHRVMASTFEQHYVTPGTTRYQLTKRDFDLGVKVMAIDKGHATRVEVEVARANEWVALADAPTTTPRQDMPLLQGTYTVSAATTTSEFGHDATKVTRGPGMTVQGREQEELASIFGSELKEADPVVAFVRAKHLRVGEVVPLGGDDKKQIAGDNPLPGTFTLGVVAADAKTVSYIIDVTSSGPDQWIKDGTVDSRVRATLVFDRATGKLVSQREQTHKLEHSADTTDDQFSVRAITIER